MARLERFELPTARFVALQGNHKLLILCTRHTGRPVANAELFTTMQDRVRQDPQFSFSLMLGTCLRHAGLPFGEKRGLARARPKGITRPAQTCPKGERKRSAEGGGNGLILARGGSPYPKARGIVTGVPRPPAALGRLKPSRAWPFGRALQSQNGAINLMNTLYLTRKI